MAVAPGFIMNSRPLQAALGFAGRSLRDASTPQEIARQLAFTRRDFLRSAAGVVLGSTLIHSPIALGGAAMKDRKVVVITFGGGARDQETFAPEGQENIPNLLKELIPQSSFFTQVVNRGILGHYVATASLATGVYETINNFASLPPESPTVFEYFRKDLRRPSSDAWVVAPSNGFNRIGESSHRSYGMGQGARVILPKHLLTAATKGSPDYEHLLRDNYETPFFAPEVAGNEVVLEQLRELLKLSVNDFKQHALTLSSPDELSVYIVRHFGRDSDEDSAGNGFQHHRTGDVASRTTWMMALGPGIREGVVHDRRVDSTDLVPTIGAIMGFSAALSQGRPVSELL